jgi:cytochrome c oxidase assembly protein subunit 15
MEWAPASGVLPPLSKAEWLRIFELYQQTPEYREINLGLSLDEFKQIFWWEYVHRLWGRLIALLFAVPFAWFAVRGDIRREYVPRLLGAFALGGVQGILGWYMVASGFAERTDVSQYRLVAHLLMAVAIYAFILWIGLALLFPVIATNQDKQVARLRWATYACAALVVVTLASGGFVAGLNAGLTYNTFPLMDGEWVPAGYFASDPWYWNWFENVTAVQFNHRLLAVATLVSVAALWLWSRCLDLSPRPRIAFSLMASTALIQVGLGVATLLSVVPVWLGALHQATAFCLLTLALWTLHHLRPSTGAAR